MIIRRGWVDIESRLDFAHPFHRVLERDDIAPRLLKLSSIPARPIVTPMEMRGISSHNCFRPCLRLRILRSDVDELQGAVATMA